MMEKSAAREACIPSFPTIPIPTSPTYIIATSFPPSPTQAILFLEYCYIFAATIAFYVGLHLHMQTEGAFFAISKNLSSKEFEDNTIDRDCPSIISMLPDIFFSNSLSLDYIS